MRGAASGTVKKTGQGEHSLWSIVEQLMRALIPHPHWSAPVMRTSTNKPKLTFTAAQ